MDTKLVETVDMWGPSLRDSNVIVNRKVPKADVQAYKVAGYSIGSAEGGKRPEDVKMPKTAEVAEEAEEVADEPKKGKTKKG